MKAKVSPWPKESIRALINCYIQTNTSGHKRLKKRLELWYRFLANYHSESYSGLALCWNLKLEQLDEWRKTSNHLVMGVQIPSQLQKQHLFKGTWWFWYILLTYVSILQRKSNLNYCDSYLYRCRILRTWIQYMLTKYKILKSPYICLGSIHMTSDHVAPVPFPNLSLS